MLVNNTAQAAGISTIVLPGGSIQGTIGGREMHMCVHVHVFQLLVVSATMVTNVYV